MVRNLGLLASYEALAKQGKLLHDPRQISALEHLETLGEHVLQYKRSPVVHHQHHPPPPPPTTSGSFFSRLFSGPAHSPAPAHAYASPVHRVSLPFNGVYLYGTVGCGKTMLMDMFYHQLKSVPEMSKSVKRTHFHPFMLDVHARLHRMRNQKGGKGTEDPLPIVAADIARENWIICFDELLVMDVADAMILRHLFSSLFELGTVMVATSNAAPSDLYKNGINRPVFLPFIKLIEDKCKIHNMSIKIDYRGKIEIADSQKGVFFGLAEDKKPKIFEDARKFALSRLLGISVNEVPQPSEREITVASGRKVQIKRTFFRNAGDLNLKVAEFDFADLFGGSMSASAADFIAISESFTSIVILNVPEIKASQESIARRFIMALDVWYDMKKTVVFVSKAVPTAVFRPIREALGIDVSEPQNSFNLQVSATGGGTSQFNNTMVQTEDGKLYEWSATGTTRSLAELSKSRHDEDLLFKRATSRLVEIQNRGNMIVLS